MIDRNLKLMATAVVVAAPLALALTAGNPLRPAQAQVAGDAQAQLYPSWTNVQAKCTGKKKKIRCRLTGDFSVVNDGDAPSGACKLDVWVSKNDVLEPKLDVKVKTFNVDPIAAGDEQSFDFSFSTPRGTKVLRRHLIAVVDPENAVAESDETDNEESIGPLH